jgi:hypothetical protein
MKTVSEGLKSHLEMKAVSGRMKSHLDMKAVSGRMTISPGYEGSLWNDDNLTWI